MTVTLYSLPASVCVNCRGTEIMLRRRKIEAEKIRVDLDPDALEYVHSLGYTQAPVVVVKDDAGNILDHWSGLSTEKIDAWAKKLAA